MNKKKTILKGFTLIELIIVLAIFSVIMTLVMSFIDPVSKLMTKTSVRERTSAYVDNIGEYVSKSIRYAQNIVIYEHGLVGGNEKELVRDFVDTYYNGGVDDTFNSLKGKVHVLKLINEDDGGLQAGKIYESVYDFKAGNGIPRKVYYNPSTKTYDDPAGRTEQQMREAGYTVLNEIDFPTDDRHAKVDISSQDISVINDEHFKDYSYYYQLGIYSFDPDTDVYSSMTSDEKKAYDKVSSKYFYSRLNQVTDSGGNVIDGGVSEYQLVMNVVSYMSENKDKIPCKKNYTYKNAENIDVSATAFSSPAAMNSIGMTLKNAQLQKTSKSVKYYRKVLDSAGDVLNTDGDKYDGTNGTPAIEAVTNNLGANPFRRITGGTSKNIYIIFTVPSEIMDTEWK